MNLSTEAKVGAITLTGFILLAYMIMHLGGFTLGEKGYPLNAVFSQVNGLKEGNAVRYAGVDIGRVQHIAVTPSGIEVQMFIKPGVKIPEGSKFTIKSDGLLGEKFIDIEPPDEFKDYLAPNAKVKGEDPRGFDQLMAKTDVVMARLDQLLKSFNDVFADESVKLALKDTVLNAKEITEQLKQFSAVLARMAINNESDINSMVHNLQLMSESLKSVAARVDGLVASIDNNGQTSQDLKEAIQNLRITSVRVEKMAASLEEVVTDPETNKNIRETLRNARAVTEKANKMLTKVQSINTETSAELLYNTDSHKYRSSADFKLNTSPQNFAMIGVTQIGEDGKLNLQVGKNDGIWTQRGGVIDGKAGVGVDAKLSDQMKLSVDLYDPNSLKIKLRTQYKISPDTYIIGQTDSLNKSPGQNTYVGVRRTF